jgi:hypothetical protein
MQANFFSWYSMAILALHPNIGNSTQEILCSVIFYDRTVCVYGLLSNNDERNTYFGIGNWE